MNEKDVKKAGFEWWQGAKRRAYTYQEKKLNQSSDYEFYMQLQGKEYSLNAIRDKITEKFGKQAEYKVKSVHKTLNDRWNREEYDKLMKSGHGVFPFMLGLREFSHGFTNSEMHVVCVHYFLRLVEAVSQDPKPEVDLDYEAELMKGVIFDLHENWKYYMDTITQAVEKLNRLTEPDTEDDPEGADVVEILG